MNTLEISNYEQQAIDFLNATSTAIKVKFKKTGSMPWDILGQDRNIYRVTIKNKLGSYSFDFGQSIYASAKNEAPTSYDVLTCLEKYGYEDFKDFCDTYGYDTDSRNPLKIYEKVKKQFNKLSILFSNEQIELLREIQ